MIDSIEPKEQNQKESNTSVMQPESIKQQELLERNQEFNTHRELLTEGIVLRVIPFRDYDQIISIFTPENGLIKILHKGRSTKRKTGKSPCMPLTKVEAIYREGRGEIFNCLELNTLSIFPQLRKELLFLEVGCDLLQAVIDSQMEEKKAPHLYALLCSYLEKIPLTPNPRILTTSFQLKLLKHDGLIGFPLICTECGKPLTKEAFLSSEEFFCASHHPIEAEKIDSDDIDLLFCLTESRRFQELRLLEISPFLQLKISSFFKNSLRY